jgi:tetratricopeptide (TPR) repeat protein
VARAAAKRKRPVQPAKPAQRRPNAPKPVEKTLFFSRIRRQTKWVFAVLAVVFAASFVVAGVGSGSTGFGSVIDALGGIFGTSGGGSSGPSVEKAQKRLDKNPRDAEAYRELAQAYEAKGDDISAINALESYLKLPVSKDNRISALNELAGLYESRGRLQFAEVQQAATDVQDAQGSAFGFDSSSPFGKALGPDKDPVRQAAITAAQQRYQQAASLLQDTYTKLEDTYRRLTANDPTEPSYLILYGQSAQQAGDTAAAIAAYEKFLKRFPDDPSVSDVRRQLKQLKAAGTTQSSG